MKMCSFDKAYKSIYMAPVVSVRKQAKQGSLQWPIYFASTELKPVTDKNIYVFSARK